MFPNKAYTGQTHPQVMNVEKNKPVDSPPTKKQLPQF